MNWATHSPGQWVADTGDHWVIERRPRRGGGPDEYRLYRNGALQSWRPSLTAAKSHALEIINQETR